MGSSGERAGTGGRAPLLRHVLGQSQDLLSAPGDTSAMRILVVDDDQAVRDSLRRSLAFNGYDVEVAPDGLAALEAIARNRPDAAVLDVMMARVDGLEAGRRLRLAGRGPPHPRV